MTYLDTASPRQAAIMELATATQRDKRQPLVVVVEDGEELSEAFSCICDCLDVAVQRMPSSEDLSLVLYRDRPMAVVTHMDLVGQDGCHVLMTVAGYDRDLPVLLITGRDPAVLGAIDAVAEIWQLSNVATWPELPGIGTIVDYLFHAGRKGDCMRLMSV